MFSGVFIVEVHGIGDKGLGNTISINIQILLEAFLSMSH
jgi:hypothetical protein